jgi:hypothetical protein
VLLWWGYDRWKQSKYMLIDDVEHHHLHSSKMWVGEENPTDQTDTSCVDQNNVELQVQKEVGLSVCCFVLFVFRCAFLGQFHGSLCHSLVFSSLLDLFQNGRTAMPLTCVLVPISVVLLLMIET